MINKNQTKSSKSPDYLRPSGNSIGNRRDNLLPERPGPQKIKNLSLIKQFLSPYLSTIIFAGIALVIAAVATLGIGQAMRLMVDYGFDRGNADFLDRYFLIMLFVIAALAASSFARHYLVSWLGERVIADIRSRVYSHVLSLSPQFFERTSTGEVLSRLTTDTTIIQSVVGSSASMALRNILLFLGGTIMLVITSPKLSGLVFIALPFILFPILIYGRRVRKFSRSTQDRVADASAYGGETLNAIQIVQAFNHEEYDRKFFTNKIELAFNSAIKLIRERSWLTASVILLVFGAVDLILWFGARDVIVGNTTPGQLTAFVFYSIVVAGSVGALSEVYGELQRAAGATERLIELLETKPIITKPRNPIPLKKPTIGKVNFNNITFEYPNRSDFIVLDGFSLQVNPGETVALVGPSGAGKTTVLQLLLRFYNPQEGSITIDDISLNDSDPESIRKLVGLVPQDPTIFNLSAYENIRYGDPNAPKEKIYLAAEAAQALSFIEELPDGFETNLGERGSKLSGGQRQRIAIARAILRNPPILLLDEATSSLDAESEKLVQTALGPLMKNRTTLVIAHRLSTILKADRIVVMDKGKIISTGTHQELYAEGGLYSRLASLQFDIENS